MKKLVSLLVVLAMLLTMAPAVFAEEAIGTFENPAQLVVGGENTAVVAASGEYWFTWTATEAGSLTIAFNESEGVVPFCNICVNTDNFNDAAATIKTSGGSAAVTVAANDVVLICVEEYDCAAATFTFTATFTPAAGSGLEGAGTEADPWVLTSLELIEGTFDENADAYYIYTATESGTYTLDGWNDCSVIVWLGDSRVDAPDQGFFVESGATLYINCWGYGAGAYSAEFTFTAGEGGGEVVTDPVGSRTNPATLPLGQEVSLSTDSMNGYFYTWTADEETLLVLRLSTDYTNWNYVVMVERDGEEAYSNENSGNADVIYATEVVYVMEGDVVYLWMGTNEGSDYVYFQADTCIGSEEIPVEPYFVPTVSRSQMIANVILPDVDLFISPYYYSYYGPMNVSVTDPSGNTTDLGLRSGEPFKTSVGGKYTITCTYAEGSSDNPFKVVENGTYTANIVNNKPYYFSFDATVAGTLTVTVGDANTEAWYYYIKGSVGYYDSNSTVASPVNPITLQVREGDKFTMQVKISGNYQNTDSAEIPVTFTFVPAETEETVTGELVLGTNELEVVGGDDEYGLSLYTYTNNSTETKTVYFTVRAWYAGGYDGVESGYLLRSSDTRMRIDGEFLTESFKVSKELAPGETVEVKLIALDESAYYATLEVSEEGFYTATAGDREKPLTLEFPEEDSAIFTPAGSDDWYVLAYDVFSTGGNLVFTGENIVIKTICYDDNADAFVTKTFTAVDGVVTVPVTEDMCWGDELLQICNVGTADVDVPYAVDYPAGHRLNPEELPINKTFDVELEEDNTGYYYTWTATEAGELTITVNGENWGYILNNNEYYATYGDSNVASLIVSEGTKVSFHVETYQVDEKTGRSTTPASTLTITTVFTAGEIVCEHTSVSLTYEETEMGYDFMTVCNKCSEVVTHFTQIEVVWNESWTAATYTVEIPAGTTVNYIANGIGSLELTVYDENSDEVATPVVTNWSYYNMGTFSFTNEGETQVFTFSFDPALGSWGKPAELVIGNNPCATEQDNYDGYYFIWTATADGELSIYVEVPEGILYGLNVNNLTTYRYMSLDEDGVDGVVTMTVSKGDEIRVNVAAWKDANGNWYPACEYNVVASFEEAATAELGDVNGDGAVNSTDAMLILRYSAGILTEDEVAALNLDAADFDGSGAVNSTDAMLVLRKSAGVA